MRPRTWALLAFCCILLAVLTPRLYDRIRASTAADYSIINTHEHVQNAKVIPTYLEAAKRLGITRTVLVGSPDATLLKGRTGFKGYDANNREVLEIAKRWPDNIIPFVTLDPEDPDKLAKLKAYKQDGARGLKLYSGHTMFYRTRLDSEGMEEIYNFCETSRLPILFHVNAGFYLFEFENVLKKHPRLKVICPHFCLSTIEKSRFDYLMGTYPQLYTDISMGFIDYLKSGLQHMSRYPEFRELIVRYQDRILFATDTVLTTAPYKTAEWYYHVGRVYRDMLESESYTFSDIPGLHLRGFHLDRRVLEKIYHRNFEKFIKES